MITDEKVLEFFIKNGKIVATYVSKNNIVKYGEYKEYLENRYSDFNGNYSEIIYRIKNGIDKIPLCKVCGKKLKYHGNRENSYGTYCSSTCQMRDKDFIEYRNNKIDFKKSALLANETKRKRLGEKMINLEKIKQTKLERYGDENYVNVEKMKKTKLERYGDENYCNTDKIFKTKLERYGDGVYTNKEKVRETMLERYGGYTLENKELREKTYKTKLERYGDEHYVNIEKAKKTVKEKYGVECVFQLKEIRDKVDYKKVSESKLKNGTFNTSSHEDIIFNALVNLFGKDDVIKEYTDKRYYNIKTNKEFNCDYYIKSLDLFIEYQGHYTHGTCQFDKNNEEHIKLIKEYEEKGNEHPSYFKLIDVWTRLDVMKREIAEKNNLNYIQIYPIKEKCPNEEEIKKIINEYFKK